MLKTVPIFAKELYELAGRKNTYWIRVIYALAIGLCFYVLSDRLVDSGATGNIKRIGLGGALHQSLVTAQFFLILLMVPPLVANAVTGEKENHTIVHLLTLPTSTANILFQKFAGRMLPVVSLLLVSVPLFALTFTLGGVNRVMIFAATLNGIMSALSVGALALAVSCHRSSSLRAIIETYVILLLVAPTCLSPIIITSLASQPGPIILSTFIAVVFITLCFAIACKRFRTHAFSQNDEILPDLSNSQETLPQNIVSRKVRETHGLPDKNPMAWLQTSASLLTQKQFYLILAGCLLAFVMTNLAGEINLYMPLNFLPFVLLVASLHRLLGAQHFVTKLRRRETLPTLLTLPITSREFLLEIHRGRMVGTLRTVAVIAALYFPTAILIATRSPPASIIYSTLLLLSIVCLSYLTLTCLQWAGLLIGLCARNAGTALTFSLLLIGIFGILVPFLMPAPAGNGGLITLLLSSALPSGYINNLVYITNDAGVPMGDIIVYLFFCATVYHTIWSIPMAVLRHFTLKRAESLLHRAVQPH